MLVQTYLEVIVEIFYGCFGWHLELLPASTKLSLSLVDTVGW